ncbi:MAG: class I SAM-dependent methyltransferase [Candidatus Electrothrix sp. AR3]|nr:class I SAM-dependent methyltransferase [Candidatus Electrothrix sp. AR3]
MNLKYILRKVQNQIVFPFFLLRNRKKEQFTCPVCMYTGPFRDDVTSPTGIRKHAQCPKCNAQERHRIQYLVLDKVLKDLNPSVMKMLHFAPEPFFRNFFLERFGQYETADLGMHGVDHKVDLQALPFKDQSYDFVFASHVLEHVPDDEKALAEICRILKPKGIAILPVPIVAEKTVEYPEPNPHEIYHVRAPGFDYLDKYDRFFSKVDKISSDSLPSKYQLFIYENRSQWPTKECPLRPSMRGEKHLDIVPVCYL